MVYIVLEYGRYQNMTAETLYLSDIFAEAIITFHSLGDRSNLLEIQPAYEDGANT